MAGPLGLSLSDIKFALEVARFIHDTWFSDVRGADAFYLEFGREISQFRPILEDLCTVLERISTIQKNNFGPADYSQWCDRTLIERQQVIGGFRETLEECQQLLEDNEKYINDNSNMLRKAQWQLSGTQEKAEKLRTRIQIHVDKISLLVVPLSLELQIETHTAVLDLGDRIAALPDRILRVFREGPSNRVLADGLPLIPPELLARYQSGLEINTPASFTSLGQFPLREGLDALMIALNQSVQKFSGTRLDGLWRPQLQQLNNLAKARWIFHCMFQSNSLREAGPDSLWRWTLEGLHRRIRSAYETFGHFIETDASSLAALGPEYFEIWAAPERCEVVRSLTEPDEAEQEEKILQVPMVDPNQASRRDMIVFRRPTNELRLVSSTSPKTVTTAERVSSHDDDKLVNLHSVNIIPTYAFPTGFRRSPKRVEIRFPGTTGGYRYDFNMDADTLQFQHALLGYKVVHDVVDCKWTLHRPALFKSKSFSGVGRVQLWQPKRLIIPPSNSSRGTSINNRPGSIYSHSNFTMERAPGLPRGVPEPLTESGDVLAAARPPAPAIVIYTLIDKKPTVLHLRLNKSVSINPGRCDCGSTNKHKKGSCKTTVIEEVQGSREQFAIRKLSEDPKAGTPIINMALFGLPRHPEFEKVEVIKDVTWLSIETADFQSRGEFQFAFQTLEAIRKKEQRHFDNTIGALRIRADRPMPTTRTPTFSQMEFGRRDSANTPSLYPIYSATPSTHSSSVDPKDYG